MNDTVIRIPVACGDEDIFDGADGSLPVYDPATGETIAQFACAGAADVDKVVSVARTAFESGPWGKMRPFERGRVMQRIADGIMARREELVRMECRDSGKPLRDAYWEVDCAARNFEFYGGAADKLQGTSIPLGNGWMDWTIREPVGVSLHIVPWNYPFQLIARGVAPALAAGCAVIIKPSEETPTTAYEFIKICREAGLPSGQVNLVPGRGPVAGDLLARHGGVDQITFTGSVATGQRVLAAAATHTIPCSMELGGKSPQILFADADMAPALDVIAAGAFLHCGQVCNAGTRLLVERRIHNQVVDALHAKAAALELGRGLDDPGLGPLISKTQHAKVLAYYELAANEGDLLLGGELPVDPALKNGNFVRPALVANASNAARVAREEIFGPILTVIPFDGVAEAISLANDSPYGLVAGVHTSSVDVAMQMSEKLRVGQIWINSFWVGLDVEFPFGGFKQSGFGREKGLEALSAYQQIKNVCVKFGPH